ncbi:hypothetical protein [Bacillus cereus]|uniref:hypothetical protein n=1 Tax=Bacillus cereus TaxID=1396 RepID=UPI000BF56512|nr:hypothetical protein [Bacillus cereus]PEX90574.1 hypothetical protein CN450_12320 [Bacillus cereus]
MKKNKRKKLRWLKWIVILPLFLALLLFGLHSMKFDRWDHEKHKQAAYTVSHDKEREAFVTQKEKFNSFERDQHHEKHHEKEFEGLFFIPFLLAFGFVLFGWLILRKSEGNMVKKWTGILLLVIGVLPALPILAFVAMIVWVYKKFKEKRMATNIDLYSDFQVQKQVDILDQWERNIRKEEK